MTDAARAHETLLTVPGERKDAPRVRRFVAGLGEGRRTAPPSF